MSVEIMTNIIDKTKKKICYWHTQYELIFGFNMFEPWEKTLLNSIIIGVVVMMSYSSYVYLPNYVRSLLNKYLQLMQLIPEKD